ncbi:Gmad2 immunoglobulin-like domain-containing protein [Neobacillus niacini]|uniref:Gmad2 immunoglobulin-like domain-containing protein n=1 Tax=Neobacillus niacini TaxID=86668 RepID=UPI00285FCA68|nr:Gmad2 immunoglobulin-like domain-containing protein [Neobacillus niacini]MDR7000341.1 heme-binding NEAT domain protein [Neobacillus niacini]
MKLTNLFMLCIILILGVIAYSLGVRVHVDVKQEPNVIEHETTMPPKNETTKPASETTAPPTDTNKPSPEMPKPPKKTDPKVYQNNSFKKVVLSEKDGKIIVKGQARVFEGVFQYAVTAENKIILQDHYQTEGAPTWGDFEISFDKSLAKKTGAAFELFVYSAKDGSKTDVLTIPLK